VVFGEVGLSGEVRHVPNAEKRIAEARKLGFKAAIGPVAKGSKKPTELRPVTSVREALNQFLET
jgi:DNA repair protein RadA/Sms